jgi:hypothetical protein
VARARRRAAWLGTTGAALALVELAAVVAAGLVVGSAPAPLLGAAAVVLLLARAADLHRPRLVLSVVEDLPGLAVAATGGTAVLVLVDGAPPATVVLVTACLVLAHTTAYAGTHLLRRTGTLRRRVLVVGTGPSARRLAETFLSRPHLGLHPVGFVGTSDRGVADQARGLPLALLGGVRSLPRAMSETQVDAVVVALPGPTGDAEVAALEELAPSDVYAVPTWFPALRAHARHPAERVGGVSVVRLHPRGSSWPVRVGKRLVEVLAALVSLAALLPVASLLALPVLVETRGVLVRRTRIDEDGRPVRVPRFRTGRARPLTRTGSTSSEAAPRRTGPVGRLLRRTGLDALPEVVADRARLVRRRRPGAGPVGSAAPAGADQPQVDAGQLAR